ncbi:hypothetical protein [Pedobacter sp. L105]|uniref:hypothetical protein n=1 Tax=Pedobacter sp. L105 TaxID=1641871 RepID=UPI00131EC6D4|nr:hypothetical protein [Pedobacter sp. L105]
MQSSYQIKLSEELKHSITEKSDALPDLLTDLIDAHGDQLGYMLQSYYSREKVSKVLVIPGSIEVTPLGLITLKLGYVIEEFNACSAIDSEKREKMGITVTADQEKGFLKLLAENWPEL